MNRKLLPIGIQTFRQIREGGYYYEQLDEKIVELLSDNEARLGVSSPHHSLSGCHQNDASLTSLA